MRWKKKQSRCHHISYIVVHIHIFCFHSIHSNADEIFLSSFAWNWSAFYYLPSQWNGKRCHLRMELVHMKAIFPFDERKKTIDINCSHFDYPYVGNGCHNRLFSCILWPFFFLLLLLFVFFFICSFVADEPNRKAINHKECHRSYLNFRSQFELKTENWKHRKRPMKLSHPFEQQMNFVWMFGNMERICKLLTNLRYHYYNKSTGDGRPWT